MKKLAFLTLLASAIVFPLQASAQSTMQSQSRSIAQSAYVGVNAAWTQQKVSGDGISRTEDGAGGKVYLGYDFNPNVGIEAGYVNFGRASYRNDNNSVRLRTKPESLYLAVTGTIPVSEQFSVFGKVGASANRVRLDTDIFPVGFHDSDKKSRTTAMVGVGLSYAISNTTSLVAEYENFGKVYNENGDHLKADLASIGVRFRF